MSGSPAEGKESVRHALPAGLIHDLRTPLNHIIGYSELLIEEVQESGDADVLSHLGKVRAAGYHLLALIEANFLPLAPGTGGVERSREPASAAPSPDRSSVGAPTVIGGTILVVDDIEGNRDLLARRLATEGYSVVTAVSGSDALAMIDDRIDLVLLDIMMPDMDGYDVLRRLKEDEGLRHIPVIMVSAIDEVDSVVRCFEMGAEDYLTKPFNAVLLKARVAACIARTRAHDRERRLLKQLRST